MNRPNRAVLHPKLWSFAVAVTIAGALGGRIARATDQPLAGAKLRIIRSATGKQRLLFGAKDPALLFPPYGSSDAPNVNGLAIDLFSPVEPAGATLFAPAAGVSPGWSFSAGAVKGYRFARAGAFEATTPVRRVRLVQGKHVAVVVDATGLSLAGPQGSVGIRIRTGTLRSCARFDGAAVAADRAGLFVGSDSSTDEIMDCSDRVLAGFAPECGDGEVNGTEACDTDPGTCAATFNFECRKPGVAGACQCCSNGGPYTLTVGCCNPSSIVIPSPPASGGFCVPTRCDGPYDCGGNTCQEDGSCCTAAGNLCLFTLYTPSIVLPACCPGLVCGRPSTYGVSCCVPNAAACANDADCCTNHCDAGACAP